MQQTAQGAGREPVGLELVGVQKRYGDVVAVKDVTLSVRAGEFLTLLGPSGSGKTTTLNMVAGFETPTEGNILLGDRDITRVPTHRRGLGMVFQSYALFPHMSVLENVSYPLRRENGTGEAKRKRAMDALEAVSLGHLAKRRPAQLSGGQQQRVALARAFVSNPPMLLMDEPLSALDKSLRTQMQEEIRRLHREIGTTVLFVTHDQEEALALSDRIVIMRDGEIAQLGSPTDIYETPNSTFTAKFLGAANFVEGRVRSLRSDRMAELELEGGGTAVARASGNLAPGDQARLVLRPEDAVVECGDAAGANRVAAVFDEIVFLGDRLRCIGRFVNGSECLLWLSHRDADKVSAGREVSLCWEPARSVAIPVEA